jgi:hypothetical protein
MGKSRFTESQIVAILKEGEAGVALSELMRKHGISRATYFDWRAKYGGVTVSEKTVGPFAKRQAAEVLVRGRGASIGRACKVARLSRTAWYRRLRSCLERDRVHAEAGNCPGVWQWLRLPHTLKRK